MNSHSPNHHPIKLRKSDIRLFFLMFPLLISVAGCTTSRLWDGSSRNVRERTKNVISASTDNIYFANNNMLFVPYKLVLSQEKTSDGRIFPPDNDGNLLVKGVELFGDYQHNYSFEIIDHIVNGPIKLKLKSMSFVLTSNYLSHIYKPWMEKKLYKISMLKYSNDYFYDEREIVNCKYFLDVDIALSVPDNFIQTEQINGHQENSTQIDVYNKSMITLYYQIAEKFINSRTGNYKDDKKYDEANSTVQPLGWLLSDDQIVSSLKDLGNVQVVGVVVTRRNIEKNESERIKITFNALDKKENVQHYKSHLLVGSGKQDSPYTSNDYAYKLFVNNNYIRSWNTKPLFVKPHDYPLTFEFHDDVTERITWPVPVKILLTPLTVASDVVLTPLYAGFAYMMESMPR